MVLALDGLETENQMRCAALFLSALFDAPHEQWFPALVVVDEAQLFAPAAAGEAKDKLKGAAAKIADQGRRGDGDFAARAGVPKRT